jgi:hypothetical protein
VQCRNSQPLESQLGILQNLTIVEVPYVYYFSVLFHVGIEVGEDTTRLRLAAGDACDALQGFEGLRF